MGGFTSGHRPLEAFPLIRTRSADELAAAATRFYGEISFDVLRGGKSFNVIANHCELHDIGLTYSNHGAPVRIELPTFDYFGQLFSLGGAAEGLSGRTVVEINRRRSYVGNAGDTVILNLTADFEQLALKIKAAALIKKLEALAGSPLPGRLNFDAVSDTKAPASDLLRRMVLFLVERLNATSHLIPKLALAELEQAIIVAFLSGNRHNQSHLLEREPAKPGPWQVRKAEEYIEQNWDQPLTVEALTIVTGVSARSIFHSFKQSRGYSPMDFVRTVRLRRANERLSKPQVATSVTDVAFSCGFGNLGHFAHYYRRQFGESPSATLNRARGLKARKSSVY